MAADNRNIVEQMVSYTTWERLSAAGESEYDHFWRMPLNEDYGPSPQIYSSNADLCSVGHKS